MSLTSILRVKENQELRTKLKEVFPKPVFKKKLELLALPGSNRYSIIGTAFDYLLRLKLESRYTKKLSRPFVAEKALDMVSFYAERDSNFLVHWQWRKVSMIEFDAILKKEFEKCLERMEEYLVNQKVTNELCQSAIVLAQLDGIRRAGYFDPNFGISWLPEWEDLITLLQLVPEEMESFGPQSFYNPTFGEGSKLVGGADADLILDDVLIEIKVTKKLELRREYFNQLIGYYLLSLIGGVNGNKDVKPINRIGVYFARHGYLWQIPLSEIAAQKTFDEFLMWFTEYVNRTGKRTPIVVHTTYT